MVPNDLPPGIRKVILIGQRFKSRYLQRQNLSSYSTSHVNIVELTIMDCGLQGIEPQTFQGLKNLTKLDVSKNALSRIHRRTFAGLRLELLRLDDNLGLSLSPGAFENLSVSSLSIQNCNLRSLTFKDLEPLIRTGTLSTLRLTGNSLTTLESRLEPLFLSLKALSLSQNPFRCDCELVWLSKMLQRKHQDEAQDIPPAPVGFENSLVNDDFRVSTEIYPVCVSPHRLYERKLIALTEEDFFCAPPQLRALELDLKGHQQTTDSIGESAGATVARLKCIAQGSPELRLGWYRRTRRGDSKQGADFLESLLATQVVSPGVAEIVLHQPTPAGGVVEDDQLTCFGSDTYGNISADVTLSWLKLREVVGAGSASVGTAVALAENGNVEEADDDSRLRALESERMDDFFFRKQFTILELIGAVIGTFTATMSLFLCGYCLLFTHRKRNSKEVRGLLREISSTQSYHQIPMPNAPRKTPAYQMLDPGLVSSTAATSYIASFVGPLEDLGNVIYTNGQVTNVTTPATTTTAHNPLLYTSYDPTIANGALYSDCPTYDSPQSRQHTPNQAPPLPPIPVSGAPSRPQLKTNSSEASASRSGLASTPNLTEAGTGNPPSLAAMEAMTGCYAGNSLFEGADLSNAGAGFDPSALSISNLSGGVTPDGLSAAAAAVLHGRLLEANAQNLLFAQLTQRRLPPARMRPVYQNQTLAYGR
ncbi:Leucine-rich repeat, immunoglobulin-like and transmembrane domains 2 [Sparganum proliferum]